MIYWVYIWLFGWICGALLESETEIPLQRAAERVIYTFI